MKAYGSNSCWRERGIKVEIFRLICFSFLFYGSIVDLQCCVSFRCIANDSVIHIYIIFQILFPYRWLQSIEYDTLCYTVGPCSFSILYVCALSHSVVSDPL